MTLLSFQKVGIKGLAACVPKNVIRNIDLAKEIGINDISESIQATGIHERRFADNKTCASDLCYEAAKVLLSDMKIKKDSIDMVIFASHTPDYKEPSTSPCTVVPRPDKEAPVVGIITSAQGKSGVAIFCLS